MTSVLGKGHDAPARHKRRAQHHWVLGSLVALVVVALAVFAIRSLTERQEGDATADTSSSPDSAASASPLTSPSSAGRPSVEVTPGARTASPMEAVLLSGRVAAAPGAALRVQFLDGSGRWADFPLPTVADEAGRFRTYVELGDPGTHRLRVTEPASGATSDVITIKVR